MHMTRLKDLGVTSTLGGNRYKVDPAKLTEHSGISIPADFQIPEAAA